MLHLSTLHLPLNIFSSSKKTAALAASLLLASATTLYSQPSTAEVQWVDRTIAVVDDDAVLFSELKERMDMVKANVEKSGGQLPPENILRDQVMEKLISESIQLQIARRAGASTTDEEVNQAIQRIQAENNFTREQFIQALKQDGLTLSLLKEQVRRDMTLQRIQQGMVSRRIKISDREVDNFLNSSEGQFWKAPDYFIGHILLPIPSDADPKAVKKIEAQAEKIVKKARSGTDFKKLAITHSKDDSALQGGDLGWRKPAQLPSLFAKAVSDMKKGDISNPTRSPAGFHILKVHDMRGASEQVVKQSKARHILLKTNIVRDNAKAEAMLKDIRSRLIANEDFAELAKEFSDDHGSALQGGELGWSMPGMFVPAFEKTMKSLAVNEISQPFKSQFGWHIMQVIERREQDFTEEFIRNQARNLLGKRRFDEELQNWLVKIRSEAYVENRLSKAAIQSTENESEAH
ncbi:MAG: peptidylprolyl isomerase [Cellvibrionaceae bacterium]